MSETVPAHPWLAHYPDGVDWFAPLIPCALPEMFDAWCAANPTKTALRFLEHALTYGELAEAANRFAKGLQRIGYGKGSTVGLCLPNTPFYVIAYYGALKAGARIVNFNPLYAEAEIRHQIEDSQTQLMVTVNLMRIQGKVEAQIGKTCLEKIISCDLRTVLPFAKKTVLTGASVLKGLIGKPLLAATAQDDMIYHFDDICKNDGRPDPVDITVEDVALLQYTGGTTGVPKGAMLTHANLSVNVEQARLWFMAKGQGAEEHPDIQERMLAVLPFFHVFSMTVQMNLTLCIGGVLIMLPQFKLSQLLRTMDDEKPTIFAGVPTLYKAILDAPNIKKYDLSSLRICVSGGAPLPEPIKDGFQDLTGLELVEGYGLSETSPLAMGNPVYGRKKTGAIGLPLPGTEVRITSLEEKEAEMPLGENGEICIRGPQVMKGYWNNEDATTAIMDSQGYLHTGDVGYMDENGYVSIVDRIKDVIIASGFKVFPRYVEEAIFRHPDIEEVVVAGVQDPYRGETVKAWIVMRYDTAMTIDDLRLFLKDKLAPYEHPKLVEFRDKLPKTIIGKPDRKALVAEEKG